MTGPTANAGQLGFDALLGQAEADNRARRIERETAHLPATMEEALPFYRELLQQHHAAMLAADMDEALRLRREAEKLALRLNDGAPGILAGPDAPGSVLSRDTAAPSGDIPLWGQAGDFIITVGAMRVRIEIEGIFGIGALSTLWPGFSANAVDWQLPFLSETGYRSFLGIHAAPVAGLTPDAFCRNVIGVYVEDALKGKLRPIDRRYRQKSAG